ncbi:MAG: hypothetical protein DCC49_01555 [Acidobacteria bacterium]|nr:MAG: hypothetical protein DCC49_01555 [Acidobacteriota bacterium]
MSDPGIERALVLGSTGFLGSHLVAHLESLGVETLCVGGPRTGNQGGVTENSAGAAAGGRRPPDRYLDIRDLAEVGKLMRDVKPTHVFHLAAVRNRGAAPEDLSSSVEVNVNGSANVAACSANSGVERLVIAGTAEEYGSIAVPFVESADEHPVTTYGISKMLATHASLACGEMMALPVAVLRISVAYGPGQSETSLFGGLVSALSQGRHFAMSLGNQTRDFVWAGDVADALVRAALAPDAAGTIVNLGSGFPITVAEAARTVAAAAGREELLGIGELPLRKGEAVEYTLDLSKCRKVLGWTPPTTLDDGVRMMLAAEGL